MTILAERLRATRPEFPIEPIHNVDVSSAISMRDIDEDVIAIG